MQIPDAEAMQAFNRAVVEEFRSNGGKVGGQFEGADLVVVDDDRREVPSATADPAGLSPHRRSADNYRLLRRGRRPPAWVHNIRAYPRAQVEIGTTSYDAVAFELPAAERDEIFSRIIAAAPGFADYQSRTARVIPLFELQRTR